MNFSNSLRIVARFVIIDGDRLQAMIKASKEDFLLAQSHDVPFFYHGCDTSIKKAVLGS